MKACTAIPYRARVLLFYVSVFVLIEESSTAYLPFVRPCVPCRPAVIRETAHFQNPKTETSRKCSFHSFFYLLIIFYEDNLSSYEKERERDFFTE